MKTLLILLSMTNVLIGLSQTNPLFIKNKENAYVQLRNSSFTPQETSFVCKTKLSEIDKENIAFALAQKKGIYDLIFQEDGFTFKILHLSSQNNTLILIHLRNSNLQITPVSTTNLEKIE
jgi:hypothetical protein